MDLRTEANNTREGMGISDPPEFPVQLMTEKDIEEMGIEPPEENPETAEPVPERRTGKHMFLEDGVPLHIIKKCYDEVMRKRADAMLGAMAGVMDKDSDDDVNNGDGEDLYGVSDREDVGDNGESQGEKDEDDRGGEDGEQEESVEEGGDDEEDQAE